MTHRLSWNPSSSDHDHVASLLTPHAMATVHPLPATLSFSHRHSCLDTVQISRSLSTLIILLSWFHLMLDLFPSPTHFLPLLHGCLSWKSWLIYFLYFIIDQFRETAPSSLWGRIRIIIISPSLHLAKLIYHPLMEALPMPITQWGEHLGWHTHTTYKYWASKQHWSLPMCKLLPLNTILCTK